MLTSELDYDLPPQLIAQQPVMPRDSSRLLVFDRRSGEIEHRRMTDLPGFLNADDVMVYNESRVIKARIFTRRQSGGKVELLFLRRRAEKLWEALARPSSRLKPGDRLAIGTGFTDTSATPQSPEESESPQSPKKPETPSAAARKRPEFALEEHLGGGRWLVRNISGVATEALLEEGGSMPLPPYIKEQPADPGRYQTIYARDPGSAAAPTAGLHFTPQLINSIKEKGAGFFPVTLHVGLDTFRPVSADDLSGHEIHSEYYRLPRETFTAVQRTRSGRGQVIAIGTTSVRVLETVFGGKGTPLEGETRLFITPGYGFSAVGKLLTNFHLPRSTLLALVMAFAGVEQTQRIYSEAIRQRYRFYSFGDAMLVL